MNWLIGLRMLILIVVLEARMMSTRSYLGTLNAVNFERVSSLNTLGSFRREFIQSSHALIGGLLIMELDMFVWTLRVGFKRGAWERRRKILLV